jgi:hypothetical protein
MKKTCSRGHVFEKSSTMPSCPFCLPGRYKHNAVFKFCSTVWMYPGAQAAWHFITVPEHISATIKKLFSTHAKAWGSIAVEATVGKTSWSTSLFPDKKRKAYVLPLKSAVRKAEGITKDDEIEVRLKIT